MKILKYLTYSLALLAMLASCDKHEIEYPTVPAPEAEFQLHYFEPVKDAAANYIDSVFLNDKLIANADGGAQLKVNNGLPGYAKFYSAQPGMNNLKLYRKGEKVAEFDINLNKGKQNVIVHSLTEEPVIIDNRFPYPHSTTGDVTSPWGTDSLATIMFVNVLYEDGVKPYEGKLQYQFQHKRTKEWMNIGEPVAFGEATVRTEVLVVKETLVDQGKCRIDYRILDENGEELMVGSTSGKLSKYSDWWNATIGCSYMHFFRGNRLGGSYGPVCGVSTWQSL